MINLMTSRRFLVRIQISFLSPLKNKRKKSEYKCTFLCKSECILDPVFWQMTQIAKRYVLSDPCEGSRETCLEPGMWCMVS